MSSIRRRRLQADHARITKAFANDPHIRVLKVTGTPPDRYQIEYTVLGLALQGDRVVKKNRHLAEIYLTSGYPRQAPQCRMLTPNFHPNIDPNAICVGDHWAAGESLANLIVRIAEIITYQSYNTKSPLNGEAARWCEENARHLPIDTSDIRSADLATVESEVIRAVKEPPPIAKGRVVRSGSAAAQAANGGPARRPAASGGVAKGRILKAKPVPQSPRAAPRTGVPRGRLVAKKVSQPGAARAQPASSSAGSRVVACSCGRQYKIRSLKAFRCFSCGTTIDPSQR
ncbi:MAG: ubiquitin-conjugating enzyme E2 [Planctomycetota bacterium]|nr:ubiquitin-conjugating enzyme E2 [Planctomycetota bacterium]